MPNGGSDAGCCIKIIRRGTEVKRNRNSDSGDSEVTNSPSGPLIFGLV